MPQSSILAWLSKPAGSKVPKLDPLRDHQATVINDSTRTPSGTKRDGTSTDVGNAPLVLSVPRSTSRSSFLNPNVELRACTRDDIAHFKRLNSLLLPIPYPESFYREIIEDPLTNNITLVAVWHDDLQAVGKEKGRLVGAIRCRLLAHPPSSASPTSSRQDGPMLYLSTLVLLSPYRRHGIAARMLDIMVKRAVETHGITSVGAHVWEANDEGLDWYRKRGFREVGREKGYYRRLKHANAVIMQRDVGVMDLMDR